MKLIRFFLLPLLLSFSLNSVANGSLVVLMYHNVSDTTPRSTSVTLEELKSHIQWLQDNHFKILDLNEALNGVKQEQFTEQDYIVAISFDDSHKSVCDTAWPYLQANNIPFTFFINSEPIEKRFSSQCTLEQLQAMAKSDLVTFGNHGKTHMHMANRFDYENEEAWRKAFIEEIEHAEAFIQKKLGIKPTLFAYPYGEYNQAVQQVLNQRGYIAFGQQSGAIGKNSDWLALPRFPAAGQYANLKTLASKLKSLAFPATIELSADNPIAANSQANPPILTMQLSHTPYGQINCFLADGSPITVDKTGSTITVQSPHKLSKGRQRYNCTASSGKNGRFYWLSHQWLLY